MVRFHDTQYPLISLTNHTAATGYNSDFMEECFTFLCCYFLSMPVYDGEGLNKRQMRKWKN